MSEAICSGLVGAGYFGLEFARIIEHIPGANLTAVFTPRVPTGLPESVRVAASVEDLAANVDAVIVASPNHAHREPVLAAAAAGAHVFCEKPIALTWEDCDAMLRACQDAEVVFMAGHVLHFMPGIEQAIHAIERGVIGEPIFSRTVRTGWENGTAAPSWKKQRALAGGHHFHHIHELDLIQRIMGPARIATMVSASVPHAGTRSGDEDTLLLATLELPGDRFASLQWGSVFRKPEHEIVIQGTRGYLAIDMQRVEITVVAGGDVKTISMHGNARLDRERLTENRASAAGSGVIYGDVSRRPPGWLSAGMRRELEYFTAYIRDPSHAAPEWRSLTDGTAARTSIATAAALSRSAAERRSVAIAEITSMPGART